LPVAGRLHPPKYINIFIYRSRCDVYRGPPNRSVKLDVTDEQADLLHETIAEFLWAANQ